MTPAAIVRATGYDPDWSLAQMEGALDDRGGMMHRQAFQVEVSASLACHGREIGGQG